MLGQSPIGTSNNRRLDKSRLANGLLASSDPNPALARFKVRENLNRVLNDEEEGLSPSLKPIPWGPSLYMATPHLDQSGFKFSALELLLNNQIPPIQKDCWSNSLKPLNHSNFKHRQNSGIIGHLQQSRNQIRPSRIDDELSTIDTLAEIQKRIPLSNRLLMDHSEIPAQVTPIVNSSTPSDLPDIIDLDNILSNRTNIQPEQLSPRIYVEDSVSHLRRSSIGNILDSIIHSIRAEAKLTKSGSSALDQDGPSLPFSLSSGSDRHLPFVVGEEIQGNTNPESPTWNQVNQLILSIRQAK